MYLLQVEQVSYATYRQIFAALKFLCTVTLGRPWEVERLVFPRRQRQAFPEVLQPSQWLQLFTAMRSHKYRTLFLTWYSAGLRISEACALRVEDIDSQRMVIRVRYANGSKQRYTVLSRQLLLALRAYWRMQRPPESGSGGCLATDNLQSIFNSRR